MNNLESKVQQAPVMMKTIERHFRRESLNDYLRIFYDNKLAAHLINISEEGMMTISDLPFQDQEEYNLQIMLPTTFKPYEDNSVQRYIHLKATCRWSKRNTEEDRYYFTGFNITEIDELNQKLINSLIEDFGV
jgi:hypothetical protein